MKFFLNVVYLQLEAEDMTHTVLARELDTKYSGKKKDTMAGGILANEGQVYSYKPKPRLR